MNKSRDLIPKESKFIFYTTPDGNVGIDVKFENETVWLTQKSMAELFEVKIPTINEHLNHIFDSKELLKDSVIRKFLITAQDSKQYSVKFYSLDVIISVGYRINSEKATKFRIWATQILKEYVIKGFAMDDERLKNGQKFFNKDYFRELLERIRSIRTSEKENLSTDNWYFCRM